MNSIAVYSSKGGVGKTATAVNIAYACSHRGKKTLLCDMDPQGASSYYCRAPDKRKLTKKKFLKGKLKNHIIDTEIPDLDLLPAHFSFRNLDLELERGQGDELRQIFAGVTEKYEVMIIDCPPNMTLLAENLIMAADQVVTPVIPTTLSIRSLVQLVKLFDKLGEERKKLRAFFSMVDRRKNMHVDTVSAYRKKKIFFRTLVPYLAEVEKMGITRQPVALSQPGSTSATAYDKLWMEIWKRRKSV